MSAGEGAGDGDEALLASVVAWAEAAWRDAPAAPVLVYSTAAPDAVARVQSQLGAAAAGARVEVLLGRVAAALVAAGARRLVVAGGETAGACVQALGVRRLTVGAQIDPGVPWCHADALSAAPGGLHLALKSGNFGGIDFHHRAFAVAT